MLLVLKRRPSGAQATIGDLFVDGIWECVILEDVVRGKKVYGETAIPAGTYSIVLTMSPRFKRVLPLLLNVPGFEGIRIHTGNRASDTEGCLLPGRTNPTPDSVGESKLAFDALMTKLQAAVKAKDPITIEVINA